VKFCVLDTHKPLIGKQIFLTLKYCSAWPQKRTSAEEACGSLKNLKNIFLIISMEGKRHAPDFCWKCKKSPKSPHPYIWVSETRILDLVTPEGESLQCVGGESLVAEVAWRWWGGGDVGEISEVDVGGEIKGRLTALFARKGLKMGPRRGREREGIYPVDTDFKTKISRYYCNYFLCTYYQLLLN
jgi:hypothetical protein